MSLCSKFEHALTHCAVGAMLCCAAGCSGWSKEQKLLEGAWIATQAVAAAQTASIHGTDSEAAPVAMASTGKHPSDAVLWTTFGAKVLLHGTVTYYLRTDEKHCRLWQGVTLGFGLLDAGRNAAIGLSITR
jgi:hypothetical protein